MPELQRLRPDHAPAVLAFELANRAFFAASVPDRGDDFFTDYPARHAALLAEQESGACHFHVLVAEGTGEILGRFNLVDVADGTAELGFRLAEKATGRGLATTAVRRLFDLCRTTYGLTTLRARATLRNTASRAVLSRTGFSETGEEVELSGERGVAYVRELFVPGLELSRRFYLEAVRPLLEEAVPGIAHSAARLGSGSEVLGFDTARSADHEWGPRLQVFLHPGDVARHGAAITTLLSERLPKTFHGYPTHFTTTADAGIGVMRETEGPVSHRVEVTDPGTWFTARLGFDPGTDITLTDWLSAPTQRLAEVTAGAVFHDGLDRLVPARKALDWYPRDLWLHLLACQWQRVSQEEAFVGRCGEVGDELGSAVVAARLVRDLMRLCLLMDRRYPPYGKWLGSAFARTPQAPELTPVLAAALAATDRHTREHHLARAYETVAAAHNRLGLSAPVDPTTRPYHDRPFQVLHAERFTEALTARITDPAVLALPMTGAADQFLDNTDVLSHPELTRAATWAVVGATAEAPSGL